VDLVEMNHRLLKEPELLVNDPEGSGFLLIGLTRTENDMNKCFPGFLKFSNMMKYIPSSETPSCLIPQTDSNEDSSLVF